MKDNGYDLSNNKYKSKWQYNRLEKRINAVIENARAYRIKVTYISSAGNNLGERIITVNQYNINKFNNDPSLLMGKGEYNKYLKEQQKEALLRLLDTMRQDHIPNDEKKQ